MTATTSPSDPRKQSMLDIDAVAARLGVSVRHVRRLVNERRIPYHKWGRLLRFDPVDVETWLKRSRVDTTVTPGEQLRARKNGRRQ